MRAAVLFLALGASIGCDRSKAPEPASSAPASAPIVAAFDAGSLGTPQPSPKRLVAIGDLHGDLEATRRVLRIAGAIDDADAWIGGELVVVQTGDQIDRGDDDRKVLDLFDRLAVDAEKGGGRVVSLLGNHEVMNASHDFRYVTPGAFTEWRDARGRAAAFAPGGPYAMMLAKRAVVARVGDSIFVHGGVLPKHVKHGLDRLNDDARAWLEGKKGIANEPPRILAAEDAPIWTRMYSSAPGPEECATLDETLKLLGAKRLVMGHTPQKPGIAPACDGKAWRIDVGLAKFYGGPVQALEIRGDEVHVIDERKAR